MHQVGKFFLEFDQGFEFLVLQLQGLQGSAVLLPLGRSFFSLLLLARVILCDEFSFFVLLSKGSESGRVDGLAAQDGSELSALAALVGFAQDAKFFRDGEASSAGRLGDVRIREQSYIQVRHGWITFSP